jgi:phosphate transport system substrate-binding protein
MNGPPSVSAHPAARRHLDMLLLGCRFAVLAIGCLIATLPLRADGTLVGAGATFPFPLYQKWIASFDEKVPDAKIQYQPIGSGAGIEALRRGEVDFAASDAPLSDAQLSSFPRHVVQIPTVVGGVVPAYHLDGYAGDLRFTPELLASIYLGTITHWNDPRLKAVNGALRLPERPIRVVHRSDSSGTTYVWTDYLSKVSPAWRTMVGAATEVQWPVGVGAEGNEGVAAQVATTSDSLGYVEFIYAVRGHLSYGAVRNQSGRFVSASLETLPEAARMFNLLKPGDLRMSITNATGRTAYPIAAFTYFIVPQTFPDPAKGRLMTQFLRWALTFGQKQSASLGYAALPEEVAKQALETIGGSQ